MEAANAAFPGGDGVLGFASTGNLGAVTANGGAQILYQASPVGSPPASFGAPSNVTTVGGGVDASPFYSADGQWVYFSSNATSASGDFAVYSLPAAQSSGSGTDGRVELSTGTTGGTETADDFQPSATPDGTKVLFIRDTSPASVMQVPVANGAPTGNPTVCQVAGTPGLPDERLGDSSRAVVSPDGTHLVYEDNTGQLHLVTWAGGGVCNGAPTDVTITGSSIVTGTNSGNAGSQYFENPDWSPDGKSLILDTNAFPGLGANVLATISMSPYPTGPVAPVNLWAASALIPCSSAQSGTIAQGHEFQPIYAPANDSIVFTETSCGNSQLVFIDPVATSGKYMASSATQFQQATDVLSSSSSPNACGPGRYNRLGANKCTSISSEPGWQPVPGGGTQLPESPMAVLLPLGGIGLAGTGLVLQRRRRQVPRAS
jgi:hypothetical protein